LGPLEVVSDGGPVRLTALKQRALLALLLIDCNRVVPAELLIEALWPDQPSENRAGSLQVLISQLRRTLEPDRIRGSSSTILVTAPGGYELRVQDDALDARRFERLSEEGRRALGAGNAERARRELESGLELWRGRALADVAYVPSAQSEARRLEELRVSTRADVCDARLRLGEHAALVGELRSIIAQEPWQERFRAQLMLALYRCDRQAEALDAYQAARREMVEELGIEPSPSLQRLQAAILRHDPGLELIAEDGLPAGVRAEGTGQLAVPDRASAPGPAESPGVVGRPAWRRVAVLAAAVAAAGAAAAVALWPSGGTDRAARGGGGDAVQLVDPVAGRTLAHVPVGASPTSVAVGAGSVWVLNADDRTVSRIDPVTRHVEKTFSTGETPTELVFAGGALWVGSGYRAGTTRSANALTQAFTRVDPSSGRVVANVPLPKPPEPDPRPGHLPGTVSAVGAFGAIWAIAPDFSVVRIDARSNRVVARIPVVADAIAAGEDAIWLLAADRRLLLRVDPTANAVADRTAVPPGGTAIAAGGGAVWVTNPYAEAVLRVRPGSRPAVETIPVGVGAAGIAADARGVWIANVLTDTVIRVDPDNGQVRQALPSRFPQNIAIGAGAVWVSSQRPDLRACEPVVYPGRGSPDFIVASDLPLQIQAADRVAIRRAADAVRFVIAQHQFRAGRYTIGYRSCDNSTAAAPSWDIGRCLANAKAYAAQARVIGVIGTYVSECAQVEIPVTNRTPSGPLPMVSGWNTYSALTRGSPQQQRVLYASGERHYFRVIAEDHAQAAAGAMLAEQLGARRVFAVHSLDGVGTDLALSFSRQARRVGLDVVGVERYDRTALSLRALAARIGRTRADAVYVGARFNEGGAVLVRDLRAVLGRRLRLIVPDIFLGVPDLIAAAGGAARGVYYTTAGLPDQRLPTEGRRFLAAFDAKRPPEPDVWPPASHGAAAAETLLDAIARSDGTRRGVVAALHAMRASDSILGSLSFDGRGDTTNRAIAVWRVAGNPEQNSTRAAVLQGAVLDRVLRPPANLVKP
jgi:DNA-binding SARP family transcriptional activator/ABC-type branched-subunit amino acid transport system substrate-binding protein